MNMRTRTQAQVVPGFLRLRKIIMKANSILAKKIMMEMFLAIKLILIIHIPAGILLKIT